MPIFKYRAKKGPNDIVEGSIEAPSESEAIDRLHTTAESHHRIMVVEVMGRHAGWIAIHSGLASGADVILIPEVKIDLNEVCEILNKRHARGKGFSIKRGASQAKGRYVLFTDVDLSVPIEELAKFIPCLEDGYDVVIGSRRIKGSEVVIPQPLYRRFMGSVFYQIVYLFLFNSIRDTNCGFKCYRRDAAKQIFGRQTVSGWGFDTELLYIAHKLNYKIKEVPVRWYNCTATKVKITKVPFLTILELFRIKLNDWKGRYTK